MKILKKNTFTDLYVQQTIGISGEIQVFKLKLKAEYAENKPLRSHFFSSAKALKTYSGKQFLTFLQLIDNEQEAAILFQTKTAKSLPEYLAEKENLSDKELTTLFEQMAQCLGTLHQGMLFYPALQPNSFYVDSDGQVQLSFFDILEFRMYQYQQITPNSKIGFMNYLSPERRSNFFSISTEADIYSLGLIYWHIFLFAKSPVKNWKLITENTYFSPTETIWDIFFETCLQEEVAKRYKNVNALVKVLPRFGNETKTENSQTQKTPPPLTIEKEEQIDSTFQNTSGSKQSKQNFFDIQNLKELLAKNKTILAVVFIILLLVLFKFCSTKETSINPPPPQATENATSNEEVLDTLKEDKTVFLIDYPGYTLKLKYPEFKTEKGFKELNDDIYRLKYGKLEVKYYQKETKNYGAWTEMKNPLLASVLKSYFDKNDEGSSPEDSEKTTNGGSNTGDNKTGVTNSGGSNSGESNSGGSNVGKKCNALLQFKNNATSQIKSAKPKDKETVRTKKILEIQSYSDEDCKNCPGGLTIQSVIDHINGL